MKKIIEKKLYDTDNMEIVASWNNGRAAWHEFYYAESLLRNKKGEYFLHCKGGEGTNLRKLREGVWTNGEDLLPISPEYVQQWAFEYLDAESIEMLFPDLLTYDE